MKKMKIILMLMFLFITPGFLTAQEHRITVENTKEEKLVLKDFIGYLPVEGYTGNEIIITSLAGSHSLPARAEGLKPIYPAGNDNTGIGLEVMEDENEIVVTCLLPFSRHEEYSVKVPENMAIEIRSSCERSNEVVIDKMLNEIEINNCNGIKLTDITGPLVLSTISGNIDISFNTISSDKPFSVNSISGDIDITLPSDTETNLELRTVSGGFYSDFDFTRTDDDLKRVGGNRLNFPLNGGGFRFTITNVSGNIYLRKGN
jgi:lia operon protein LiaG